jgi:ketosteroid isomerase-like protein
MTDYVALTKEFYELLLSDFEAAVTQFLADDFVWENPLPTCVPFGGVYHGAEGLAQYFKGLSEAIEMSPLHFDEMIAGDGIVAAIGVEANTHVLPTGKRYDMPFVHVIRFNDEGKVTHVREYNDTREMVAAFGGNT